MSGSRNRVENGSTEKSKPGKKLKKFWPYVAGKTMGSHEKIIRKLKRKGAKQVDIKDCHVVIVFCPIVSRFESDISAALSEVNLEGAKKLHKVILVAMHHTLNADYTLPPKKEHSLKEYNIPVVHCLFHETKGLLKSAVNKEAVKSIRTQMDFKDKGHCTIL